MNNLTNFYRNKSEVLAEQIKILENQLKQLEENAPASVFKAGAQGQQAFSDDQLRDQMRQHKKSSLFKTYKDEEQTQEYRDAQAELARREAAKNAPAKPAGKPAGDLMAANKAQRTKDLATEPSQAVSKAVVAQQKAKAAKADTSYDAAEAARSRRSAETKPQRQMAATPTLLQRDPNVPTPPAQGQPAPVAGGKKPEPTTIGPNSDFANQQRSAGVSDMVKDALNKAKSSPAPDTSFNTSLFGSGQPQAAQKPSYNFQQSSKQISDMASNLLAGMGKAPTQATSGTKAPSAPTQTGYSSKPLSPDELKSLGDSLAGERARGRAMRVARARERAQETGKPTPNKNAVGGGIGTGVDFTTGSESQGGLFGFSHVPTKNGKYLPQQKSSTVSQEYFDRVHPGTKPSSMKEVEARNALANTPQQSAMDAMAKYRQEIENMVKLGKK